MDGCSVALYCFQKQLQISRQSSALYVQGAREFFERFSKLIENSS